MSTCRIFTRIVPAAGLVTILLVGAGGVWAQDARPQDHEELRALLRTIAQAISGRDFQALASVLDQNFVVTTVDQKRFTSLDAFRAHWEGLFTGNRAFVRKVTIKPTADELTRFLAQDVGLSTGASEDTWEFTDGDTRVMKVRWTVVVRKADGRWRLASAHVGTDLLDNPVLQAAKQWAWRLGTGLGIGGLVIGALGGVVFSRRRR
ncbi:MAG TPA: nuclear transport factor 2 family protein [Candidatus Acidoferrum sp.]|nr:nuclear transport factor 2 family protein [Candidatus Acidoferrum sp.]